VKLVITYLFLLQQLSANYLSTACYPEFHHLLPPLTTTLTLTTTCYWHFRVFIQTDSITRIMQTQALVLFSVFRCTNQNLVFTKMTQRNEPMNSSGLNECAGCANEWR